MKVRFNFFFILWSNNIYLKQECIKEKIIFDRTRQINKSIRFSSKSFCSDKKEEKYYV